ncbi:hypothetical protein V8F33_010615 [Rhypophila sp. PSN 637]
MAGVRHVLEDWPSGSVSVNFTEYCTVLALDFETSRRGSRKKVLKVAIPNRKDDRKDQDVDAIWSQMDFSPLVSRPGHEFAMCSAWESNRSLLIRRFHQSGFMNSTNRIRTGERRHLAEGGHHLPIRCGKDQGNPVVAASSALMLNFGWRIKVVEAEGSGWFGTDTWARCQFGRNGGAGFCGVDGGRKDDPDDSLKPEPGLQLISPSSRLPTPFESGKIGEFPSTALSTI